MAGYFDGEGTIRVGKGSTQLVVTVSIATGDKRTLELFAGIFGGNLVPQKVYANTKRQIWCWRRYGVDAQDVLRTLLPYLVSKRLPALAAMRCKHERRNGGLMLDPQETHRREWAREFIHNFNQRVTIPQTSAASSSN